MVSIMCLPISAAEAYHCLKDQRGSQIKKLIDDGKLTHLEVHSIDRLGRDTLSVLQLWKDMTIKGIRVVCRNPNFQNINDEGKTDMFSELHCSQYLASWLILRNGFRRSVRERG